MNAVVDIYQLAHDTVYRARREPIWAAEHIFKIRTTKEDKKHGQNWDLDIWAKELIESVADVWRYKNGIETKYNHEGKNKITVRAMHGPGKTFAVAYIMHWWNLCFNGKIVCTAPKEAQLRTRLWPEFRKIRNRAGEGFSSLIKVDATKIVWCECEDIAKLALAETANSPENLSGHHEDYQLFIVDEASGVHEDMYPVIEGAQSTGILNVTILISNPTKNQGTFFDSHMREVVSKHYYQIHVDLKKTKRIDKDWVRQQRAKYGKDSPVFKIRCLGEFADGDSKQLYVLQWLLNARDHSHPITGDGSISRLRISVDVADGGLDESVITACRIYDSFDLFLKMARFSFPAAEAPILTAEAAARMFDAFNGNSVNGDDLVVDSLGVGAGTAGHLIRGIPQENGGTKKYPVVIYKGGESSDNNNSWRNRRVQTHMVARDALQEGTVAFAEGCFESEEDWDDFCAQMCSIHREEGTGAKEDLETKKHMKERGIKSPDIAESFIMRYATQAPTMLGGHAEPEVIGVSVNAGYDGGLV